MSAEHASDENLIVQATHSTLSHIKETMQLMCLCAVLSTYLFVILKLSFIQNNKALGGKS